MRKNKRNKVYYRQKDGRCDVCGCAIRVDKKRCARCLGLTAKKNTGHMLKSYNKEGKLC